MSDRLTPALVATLREMLKDRGELGDLLIPGERAALAAAIAQAEAQQTRCPECGSPTCEGTHMVEQYHIIGRTPQPSALQAAIRKIEALRSLAEENLPSDEHICPRDILAILRDVQEGTA